MFKDVVQLSGKQRVHVDRSRDRLLTSFSKATLENRYLLPGESYQDAFARVASYYGEDQAHAQRIYDYISRLWFMPATPVLSNGGSNRGLPISCFLNEADDSLASIVDIWTENVWLASRGGGIGSYWGNLRSIGEKISINGTTSGIMPFIRVMDTLTLAISQGSLRRGNAAVYLQVSHPEIEEFIEIRRPTGGDPNRKAQNLHHGVLIPDAFMRAVENDEEWALISPRDGSVIRMLSARALWIRLLTARVETGEPYFIFIDNVNRAIPEHHKLAGLAVKMSNLCSEITLPTGIDHHGKRRTAVCCLSSVNLEYFNEWRDDPLFIEDILRFLDNVLDDFTTRAPDTMASARYAAMRERSVGLGMMGFHSFLQANEIPIESALAKAWNRKIFKHIDAQSQIVSEKLADEKGACPDAAEFGFNKRFSNTTAIAPTASISTICGQTSPGIEPYAANSYNHKTLSGSYSVHNKHLEKLLQEKGRDDEETWTSITVNEGSVQHLDFLSDHEKAVFKTAFEIDQRWLIDLSADRTPFISQAQSLNVFMPSNIHKRDLHQIHFQAWQRGVKSMYYCRSKSIQRAEVVATNHMQRGVVAANDAVAIQPEINYEECLACQ
ncbi:MAG: ribonucleoside-diphosphate reductase subunit alpha [Pseudomonadota bacterium]